MAGAFWKTHAAGDDESDAVSAAIATVLDRIQGKDDTVTLLARGLGDKDAYVRLAAAAALARAKSDHPDTVPALRKLLEHQPHFFCYTTDTLTALGSNAAPLAPQIQPLLRHPDEDVSRAVARVLRRIDPSAAAKGWGAAGAPGAVPDNLVPLWDDLTTDDALRADLAVWRLAGAGSRAVTLLGERLRPPPVLTDARIARLIADLDNDDFATRERTSADLAAGIESAAPALRRALADKPTAETRRQITKLLDGLDPTRDPEQRRRLRAVRLLEEMGGADARALLERLSRGDDRFVLTREATTALRYLDRP
jgi:HEAT repeat protein